ncbi:aldolase [Opitutia bacterium ISCC 51]|nr:aldolase [Opitutae bacterium ISCC 51]QXD28603.1 aldolase [Opitutae bacterium ISCC 52]
MSETKIRDGMAELARSLHQRGYGVGSSGKISCKLDDGILVTPTNSCMGFLDPEQISKVDFQGNYVSGGKPSKEAFLHLEMYQSRPQDTSVVHLHSTYSVAASCLKNTDPDNLLPPITAYYVMKVGQLKLIPYYAPGDQTLAQAVGVAAKETSSVLLANHGPVIAGKTLESAVYAAEELEETAKLYFILEGRETSYLNAAQIADLNTSFPS